MTIEFNLSMIYDLEKKETSLVLGNHECEEKDSVNCVNSSLKSHLLWVTL